MNVNDPFKHKQKYHTMSALFIAHTICSICQSPRHYPVAERGNRPELGSIHDNPRYFLKKTICGTTMAKGVHESLDDRFCYVFR